MENHPLRAHDSNVNRSACIDSFLHFPSSVVRQNRILSTVSSTQLSRYLVCHAIPVASLDGFQILACLHVTLGY